MHSAYIDHQQELYQNFAAQYHSDIRVFVFQRHISIILYVLSAIGVTFLSIACWSIEATLDFPTIFSILWTPVRPASYNSADQAYLYWMNNVLLSTKLVHFILMRDAECFPKMWANKVFIAIFHHLDKDDHHYSQLNNASTSSLSDSCHCNDLIYRLNKSALFFLVFEQKSRFSQICVYVTSIDCLNQSQYIDVIVLILSCSLPEDHRG